jgi:molybdopterin-guanine dinucleotide biosynthesis protein A
MGRDKAFVEYDGVPMIQRVMEAMTAGVGEHVIIANDTPRYESLGVPVYGDILPGHGPLSGLHAAFAHTGADQVFLVACDMPTIDPAIVDSLVSAQGWSGDALLPVVGGYEQGMFALYRPSAIEKVMDDLQAGVPIQFDLFRRRIKKTFVTEKELAVWFPDYRQTFINVNRPEDILS